MKQSPLLAKISLMCLLFYAIHVFARIVNHFIIQAGPQTSTSKYFYWLVRPLSQRLSLLSEKFVLFSSLSAKTFEMIFQFNATSKMLLLYLPSSSFIAAKRCKISSLIVPSLQFSTQPPAHPPRTHTHTHTH